MMCGRQFTEDESQLLQEIIINRRDVRGNRFLSTPLDEADIEKILLAAVNAPSVGFSQPWEFVVIQDENTKNIIKDSFQQKNNQASNHFSTEKQALYQRLKLEGITDAPINIAVFYKPSTQPVLGQTAMPEMGQYSVVCAVQNMWLMARSLNIGMGWVSILDPDCVKKAVNAPKSHQLIAYLCLGYVDAFLPQPELEQLQWEKRKQLNSVVMNEKYVDC